MQLLELGPTHPLIHSPTHSLTHLVSLLVGSDDKIMFSEAERDPVEEGEDMKYARGGGRAENSGQL